MSDWSSFDPRRSFKGPPSWECRPIELTDDDVQTLIDRCDEIERENPLAAKLLLFLAGCRSDSADAIRMIEKLKNE